MKTEAEIRGLIDEQQHIANLEHEKGEAGSHAWYDAMKAIAWLPRVLGE